MEQNIELDVNPHIYSPQIFTNVKEQALGRGSLFNKWCWENFIFIVEE
jgi:hypothetical protein